MMKIGKDMEGSGCGNNKTIYIWKSINVVKIRPIKRLHNIYFFMLTYI